MRHPIIAATLRVRVVRQTAPATGDGSRELAATPSGTEHDERRPRSSRNGAFSGVSPGQ